MSGVFGVGIPSALNMQSLLDKLLDTALAQNWYGASPRGCALLDEGNCETQTSTSHSFLELFQLTQQAASGGEVPLLAWEDIMEIVQKVGIPENKVVECLKTIELLGHIMYFPGMQIEVI